MTFAPGSALGPYEIVAPLGAGGMGEVLRARDTKLGREVAIKVLPAAFAQDAERLARFRREAQILASLNHSNIAAIYGLEESEGVLALVMELVEGEDLSERLKRGAVPIEDAVLIAKQIADALEEAHEKGIVHRDLKPANVKVTADGKVKVLDFGLAKAFAGDPASSASVDLSQSPTLATVAGTRMGVILGTAAYMSPEQARGKTVDKRADIWAFGVVLFEMLSGQRLFAGETVSDTLAAVLRQEIDWKALPEATPWKARRLLERCLARDPKARLRDVGEVRIALEGPDETVTSAPVVGVEAAAGAVARARTPWMVATVVATLMAIGALWTARKPADRPQPLRRFSVELGAEASLFPLNRGSVIALSPDGTTLAFTARPTATDPPRLFVRRLDQLRALELPGTEGARHPFFSPDGQWIAFFTEDRLVKVATGGGAVVTLCPVTTDRAGTWTEDGQIVFAAGNREGLSRVGPAGGAPVPFTTLDEKAGEITHRSPQVLPGGRGVIYAAHTRGTDFSGSTIWVQPANGQPRKKLLEGGLSPHYFGSGHLLFVREGTLFAAPFDLDRLETTGPPVPAVEQVHSDESSGGAMFAIARDGTFAHVADTGDDDQTSIAWLDNRGVVTPLGAKPAGYTGLRVSPDGSRIAVVLRSPKDSDVWVYEWQRDTMSRLTFGKNSETAPAWTPDGGRIAFSSDQKGPPNLYWKRSDGTGEEQRLTDSPNAQYATSWHPSGKFLAFLEFTREAGVDIRILPMDGDETTAWKAGTPTTFLGSPFSEWGAVFSPDGRWVAYTSNESGRSEVYIRPFPGPGGKWQVSTDGGNWPFWSVDGRQLFFRHLNQVMAAAVRTTTSSLSVDKPVVWSSQTISGFNGSTAGAVRGEERLLVLRSMSAETQLRLDKIVVTGGFVDELRRLTAPAGK
ncbi:MAG: protein kinase [Vicinamibacteria bacterium]|nr:protein kinase [Vicinamibacteria bacterium]